jgi:succinate dehydrogenase flavin-adding protein (antitoxin of CptAB toxin-antitoxin module)
MKELDVLLDRYVRERYATAAPGERAAFEALLALPDPEIADYLLGYRVPLPAELAEIVKSVLKTPVRA